MRVLLLGILVVLGLAAPLLLRRRLRPRWLLAVGLGLGTLTALVVRQDGLRELRAEDLVQARELWRRARLLSYSARVEVRADRLEHGRFDIEVRDGAVTRAVQNGIPTSGSGAAYTIDGLFELLEREIELAAEPDNGFGAPAGYRVYLRVRFHPRLGYPERYRRSVGGTANGVEIAVQRLVPAG